MCGPRLKLPEPNMGGFDVRPFQISGNQATFLVMNPLRLPCTSRNIALLESFGKIL